MGMRVVIAWSEMDGMEKTGRMVQRDGVNWFPEFRPVERPRAAVWLNCGTKKDQNNAAAHLDTITDKVRSGVYMIPSSDRDPLGTAKRMLMAQ